MQQNVANIFLPFFFSLDDIRHFHAVQSDGRIKASQSQRRLTSSSMSQ